MYPVITANIAIVKIQSLLRGHKARKNCKLLYQHKKVVPPSITKAEPTPEDKLKAQSTFPLYTLCAIEIQRAWKYYKKLHPPMSKEDKAAIKIQK
jgi:hypothetical protein